jgi:predicted nucleotidyltransferase
MRGGRVNQYTASVKVGVIELDEAALSAFCEKWGVAELSVFGSALRDDFRPDSDIDFLVTWKPGVRRTWHDIWSMKEELGELVGREAGIAQRHVVESDANPFRRRRILESATRVYAAA